MIRLSKPPICPCTLYIMFLIYHPTSNHISLGLNFRISQVKQKSSYLKKKVIIKYYYFWKGKIILELSALLWSYHMILLCRYLYIFRTTSNRGSAHVTRASLNIIYIVSTVYYYRMYKIADTEMFPLFFGQSGVCVCMISDGPGGSLLNYVPN